MAEVKLIDIVKMLSMSGRQVQYIRRKDGSIRITKIDGQSYTGSAGNKVARELMGFTLSESRAKQLKAIRTPEGQFGHRRKAPLPEEIEKKIRRVQRIWRKNKVKADGYVGRKGTRWTLEHYGEEEAYRQLEEQERYGLGLAYTENVKWIIKYIEETIYPKAPAKDQAALSEFMRIIASNISVIKEADIGPIHRLIYDYEHWLEGLRNGRPINEILAELKKLYQ